MSDSQRYLAEATAILTHHRTDLAEGSMAHALMRDLIACALDSFDRGVTITAVRSDRSYFIASLLDRGAQLVAAQLLAHATATAEAYDNGHRTGRESVLEPRTSEPAFLPSDSPEVDEPSEGDVWSDDDQLALDDADDGEPFDIDGDNDFALASAFGPSDDDYGDIFDPEGA